MIGFSGLDFLMLFIEGFLAFVSPCILPVLPIYLLYLAGDRQQGRSQLLLNSLGFILGFTFIFTALGATASSLGALLQQHSRGLQLFSSLFILAMGLYYSLKSPLLSRYTDWLFQPLQRFWLSLRPAFLARRQEAALTEQPKNLHFFSSLLFGMAFCASWTPCLMTFLSTALLYSAQAETLWLGSLMLLTFSLGLGLPFFLSALFFNQLKSSFAFLRRQLPLITLLSGFCLIGFGLYNLLVPLFA